VAIVKQDGFTLEFETKKFNDFINSFITNSSVEVDKALRKFAFDFLRKVILKNPVDTGRSRAGWFVAMSKLGGGSFPQQPKKSTAKKPKGYSGAEVSKGMGDGEYKEKLGKNVINKFIEIVNGVPYIIYLEYGYSNQSPLGMVRVSMREITKDKLPKDMGKRLRTKWNRYYNSSTGNWSF